MKSISENPAFKLPMLGRLRRLPKKDRVRVVMEGRDAPDEEEEELDDDEPPWPPLAQREIACSTTVAIVPSCLTPRNDAELDELDDDDELVDWGLVGRGSSSGGSPL